MKQKPNDRQTPESDVPFRIKNKKIGDNQIQASWNAISLRINKDHKTQNNETEEPETNSSHLI